jgi:iron complex transport system substrate-binding protein
MGKTGETLKACSFLPGATDMILRMGLADQLVGITFECHAEKPRVVRSVLEDRRLSSEEIDRVVKEHVQSDTPLYSIEMDQLRILEPDVIFTQHVCNVCQIGTAFVEKAIHALDKQPKLVPLVPKTFEDVLGNAITIARELGMLSAGEQHVADVRERCRRLTEQVSGADGVRVAFIEWINPVFNSGHWIPDMVSLAGGVDLLGVPGGHSGPMDWAELIRCDPDVIVVAPCGLPLEQASCDMHSLAQRPGWGDLRSVRSGRVYIVHPDLYTCPSTSLVEGVELLAALLHPDRVDMPNHTAGKWMAWSSD